MNAAVTLTKRMNGVQVREEFRRRDGKFVKSGACNERRELQAREQIIHGRRDVLWITEDGATFGRADGPISSGPSEHILKRGGDEPPHSERNHTGQAATVPPRARRSSPVRKPRGGRSLPLAEARVSTEHLGAPLVRREARTSQRVQTPLARGAELQALNRRDGREGLSPQHAGRGDTGFARRRRHGHILYPCALGSTSTVSQYITATYRFHRSDRHFPPAPTCFR